MYKFSFNLSYLFQFIATFIAYSNNILYIANKATVFVLDVKHQLEPGEQKRMDLGNSAESVQRIIPGLNIHGLFNHYVQRSKWFKSHQIIIAMETDDNQLDFSQIVVQNMGTKNFTYQLKQQRELVERKIEMDSISKFQYIIDEQNVFYGIALRQTGHFDIYWNMTLIDSPTNSLAKDVTLSFDEIYMLMLDGEIRGIETTNGSSITYEQSTVEHDEFEFPIIFYQNIKNHGKLQAAYLFSAYLQQLYFNKNYFESQWLKHAKFTEGQICRLVKKLSKGTDNKQKEKHELAAILDNGSIYNDIQCTLFADEKNKKDDNKGIILVQTIMNVEPQRKDFEVAGEIFRVVQDQQKNEWLYIMTKEKMYTVGQEPNDLVRLFILHYNKLYEVKEGLEHPLDIFTNLVHVFCPAEEPYLVLQKHSQITLYHISLGKPPLLEEEEHTNLGALLEDEVILQSLMSENLKNVQGDLHSSMSMNISDHIFFVDSKHFYLYQFSSKQTKIFKDQNCVGLYVVDNKFCYTLSHTSGSKSSGLRLYDINNILTKDTDVSYMLSNVQVGFSGLIDWNQDYSRFSILKSLDCLNIVPALHRNTIAFIGMSKRDTYLATKVIKDRFIALDHKNYIFCWSVVTGKLLSVHKLPTRQDYSNFQTFSSPIDDPHDSAYKREWFSKILLVKQEKESDFDEKTFYKNEGVFAQAHNQVSFAQSQLKEFREFRLIEIVSEVEIKEHLVFVHPFYTKEKQRLYFDSKNQYMIEKLGHPRVFFYEKEENKMRRTIKWKCIRRFSKYPEELENDSGYIRALSPSFLMYIDINRLTNQFVMKDTLTMQELYKIPKDLMNLEEESAKQIMNRFKWVDDDTIRLINQEGIEKILDVKDGELVEREFNVIPLFDNDETRNSLRHYYSNRCNLSVSDVKERLLRKYQSYKTAYYLEHNREPTTLYNNLFTVDYQVDNGRGMHIADLSFTFLHWKIMEQLEMKALQIELIDNSQIELLIYNILPGGDTALHKLSNHGDVIKKIFQIAHPNEENVKEIAIHVPFLQNLKHLSPMHNCKIAQDIRTMDTMLSYLCGYGVDHHSRAITELLPFIIEKQLPSLLPYLDSRLVQTKKLAKITKGCLKPKTLGITESKFWFKMDDFEKKLLEEIKEGDESQIEKPIKAEFFDIPRVYHYEDDLCDDFFGELASTDQYDVFSKKGIQKMIEFNYPLVKKWTIRKLFIPFVMFQVTLFVYLNFVFKQTYSPLIMKFDFPMQLILGLFACYFLQNEIFQMKTDGLAYLSSVWNYIDIITPSTIMTVVCINAFDIHLDEESERILQAIGVFFMWFKFLYFFRIFKNFGYLTRLIIIVINDMKTFLFVMFFTIVAFSDSLLTLSNGNVPEKRFVDGFGDSIIYTYRIILGDFNVDEFGDCGTELVYALFIMCTVFNTIVMLNLLIAIISESFSAVKENAANAAYQEMASMIAENSYLIPKLTKHEYAEKNRYMLFVCELENEMEDESDEVIHAIDLLKKNMLSKISSISKSVKKVKSHLKNSEKWQEQQDYRMHQVMNMIEKIANKDGDVQSSRYETESNMDRVGATSSKLQSMLGRSFKMQMSSKGSNMDKRFTMMVKKN